MTGLREHGGFRSGDLVRVADVPGGGLVGYLCRLLYYSTGVGCWRVNFTNKGNAYDYGIRWLLETAGPRPRFTLIERRPLCESRNTEASAPATS